MSNIRVYTDSDCYVFHGANDWDRDEDFTSIFIDENCIGIVRTDKIVAIMLEIFDGDNNDN